jgi:hypothetical protein
MRMTMTMSSACPRRRLIISAPPSRNRAWRIERRREDTGNKPRQIGVCKLRLRLYGPKTDPIRRMEVRQLRPLLSRYVGTAVSANTIDERKAHKSPRFVARSSVPFEIGIQRK